MKNTVQDVANAAPAASFATMHFLGVPLPDWAAMAALIYSVLQIANTLWRWSRAWRSREIA